MFTLFYFWKLMIEINILERDSYGSEQRPELNKLAKATISMIILFSIERIVFLNHNLI